MTEFIIGLILVAFCLYICRQNRIEGWVYSVSLFGLPLVYMFFALFADSSAAILLELIAGLPFIIAGFIFLQRGFKYSAYLLAGLWLSHAYYDIDHNRFFINSGVPDWYPLLCVAFDLVIGFYLIYLGSTLKDANLRHYSR